MTTKIRSVLIMLAILLTGMAYAQKPDVKESVSLDPAIRTGKLDNGLHYYIKQNKKPENRIEMRLAVNAGSMQESEFQKGLAHFAEHMCFNGTKNFPKNELINYLQKTGVQFGADINAYTAFDETVYMLQLPADDKELVEKGFLVLEDWAHQVTFEDKEIDKERGIIVEEWRSGLGADDRMRRKYFPVIFKGSRYAERLPIGDINIIQNFKYDTLRHFYRDWYRPSLQAIVVVGDIDVDQTEQKIREQFAGLKDPNPLKPRIDYEIPDNAEPLIAVASDKEATSANIMIFFKHPRKAVQTVGDFRQTIINELYTSMLNERLQEYRENPEAPFIYAYNYYGRFLARSGEAYGIMGMVKENMISQALHILLLENERVKRYGFFQTELDRMKEDILAQYERKAKEFDKTESSIIAGKLVDHYLASEPVPGARAEYRYVKALLPAIHIEEVNALSRKWITDHNMVVVITAPEKEGIAIPSEKEVLEAINNVKSAPVQAYVDKFKDEPLIDETLQGSPIEKKEYNESFDYTRLILKNGVRVIVKTTDFKNDEVLFYASSPGGTSLYSTEDHISAFFASQFMGESGLGKFDNTELQKTLKGKNLEINAYISDVKEGFSGKASPKDLETLLQLTYLYFAEPRNDSLAFESSMSRLKSQMMFISNNPMYTFIDTLLKAGSNYDPRMVVLPKEKDLNRVSRSKMYRVFRDRFADAGDFTFYLVGNVHPDTVAPLLEKYLGSLPVTGRKETWKDVSAGIPQGITNIKVFKGSDPKSMVGIVMQRPMEWTDENRIYLRMLKEIINIKLIEVIREEMSGVYSPQVQMSAAKFPKPEMSLMIMFGCSPKNTEKLTKAVFKIMDNLQKKGPSETDLGKARELLLREREVDMKSNTWWMAKLESAYFEGDVISLPEEFRNKISSVTLADLQKTAQTYLGRDQYVRAVLFPLKKKGK